MRINVQRRKKECSRNVLVMRGQMVSLSSRQVKTGMRYVQLAGRSCVVRSA